MRRFILGFLSCLILVYIGLCAAMFFAQDALIYYPVQVSHASDADAIRLQVHEAELVITTARTDAPTAIVYFGGNAEDVSRSLPTLQSAFPDKAIYLMHYRAYGGSTGKPSEAALLNDALVLYDFVRKRHDQIEIFGRSLGSGVATYLASQREASRLILITPYHSLENIARLQYPYLPVGLLLRDKFESFKYAPNIAAPTLLIAAELDQLIPMKETVSLQGKFKPNQAKLVVVKQAWHNNISNQPEYLSALQTPTSN